MRQLLIATRSKGKFPQIVAGLNGVPYELVNLDAVSRIPEGYEVAEPAATFEGNALIKAFTLGYKAGMLTLADDAGLEVDALDGRPGVRSARYAPGSDEDRYQKLLGELEGVPKDQRTARFRTVMALFDPETDEVVTCDGVCEGRILMRPRGTGGFGYDPIFFDPVQNKSFAEMSSEETSRVSHRGQALAKIREILIGKST